jgi:metal-responsive CopG/Arc/MetJ family transcriptional regulator
LSRREKGAEEGGPRKRNLVLVEFKVPRDLLEKFDSKWRSSRFSTRSEAIRFLLRMFVQEPSERSQYCIASAVEGFKM